MKYVKINSIFKRDEVTHKLIPDVFSMPEYGYLLDNLWYATEKIDGTNIRIYKTGEIKGRTENAQIPAFAYPILENIRKKLIESDLPESTVLYGELYGNKIHSGSHYIKEGNDFCLFDVMMCDNYQSRDSVKDVGLKLDLKVTPIMLVATLREIINSFNVPIFKESLLHKNARNEGFVCKPLVELQTRDGKRIITKLKFKDFN